MISYKNERSKKKCNLCRQGWNGRPDKTKPNQTRAKQSKTIQRENECGTYFFKVIQIAKQGAPARLWRYSREPGLAHRIRPQKIRCKINKFTYASFGNKA